MVDCEEVPSVEGECVSESVSLDQPLNRPSIQDGVQVQDNQDVVSVASQGGVDQDLMTTQIGVLEAHVLKNNLVDQDLVTINTSPTQGPSVVS